MEPEVVWVFTDLLSRISYARSVLPLNLNDHASNATELDAWRAASVEPANSSSAVSFLPAMP